MVWLKFLLCLVIILFSGTKLAQYGDAIARKTGLGGIWIGLLLIAAITSVPELVTGVSSAALIEEKGPEDIVETNVGAAHDQKANSDPEDIIYVNFRQDPVNGLTIQPSVSLNQANDGQNDCEADDPKQNKPILEISQKPTIEGFSRNLG